MAQTERAAKRRSAPRGTGDLDTRIVDAAIALAEDSGWDAVRLRRVAARLGVSLAEVLARYRDLDAVADAWFLRAWAAMLAPPPRGFAKRPARERIHVVMMRWFDALAGHRRVTGEMISTKVYPSHPHHWAPMIFNLSRTIHWLREAALLDATGRRRQMEEVGLTVLFLITLRTWLRDESENQARTRDLLRRRLAAADGLMARLWRGPEAAETVSSAAGSGRRGRRPGPRRT